ncbi:MAG: CPBP family intramembrane metalloprotease [Planctomycetes bacterium]|nr:CPBP family intramembrane metalloprotease [Planctomycetota bacterium]
MLLDGPQVIAVRNGADTWMRGGLLQMGLDRPWALPVLILAVLIGWQVIGRLPWRVSIETLIGMGAESLLGAVLLLLLGQVLSLTLRHAGWMPAPVEASLSPTANAIGFLGAGIYEEVLFRLLLLPAAYLLLRMLLLSRRLSATLAVLATSTIFALAHYLDPSAGAGSPLPGGFLRAAEMIIHTPETWFSFCFRWVAGLIFALMFMLRGFGITVGCHAIYDLLVGIVIASHF